VLGTTAIIGALNLNSVVDNDASRGMARQKARRGLCEKAREKKQKVFQELKLSNRRSTINLSSKTKWSSLRSLKEDRGTGMPLLNETLKVTTFNEH